MPAPVGSFQEDLGEGLIGYKIAKKTVNYNDSSQLNAPKLLIYAVLRALR